MVVLGLTSCMEPLLTDKRICQSVGIPVNCSPDQLRCFIRYASSGSKFGITVQPGRRLVLGQCGAVFHRCGGASTAADDCSLASGCKCERRFHARHITFHAELFSLAYWWAVFLAFGERMRSLTSVLQSIALNLHVFD